MRSPLLRAGRYLPEPLSNWTALILVGGAFGLVAACAAHGAGVEGQVFEVVNPEAPMSQWTRVPSADAYVIVHWQGTIPRPGHYESVCLHAAIGKTDARGRFEVSGSWAAPKGFPVIRRDPAVMVHKPGFVQQSDVRSGGTPVVRTLVCSTLAPEQRIELLSMYAESGCLDQDTFKIIPLGDPQRNSVRFDRALYEEAQALGPLPPALNPHLMSLREKAGVPEPEQPARIRVIPPRGPRGVAPTSPTLPDPQ